MRSIAFLGLMAIVVLGACQNQITGDAGLDAGASLCVTDASCNDGDYCNGEETCEGRCVDGTPPCTVDEDCDEDGDICNPKPYSSSFRFNDDGWRVLGGPFAQPTRPSWEPFTVTGGGDGEWYWQAPSKFLGELSALFGKRLTFEWSVRTGCRDSAQFRGLVRLTGSGQTLVWGGRPRDPVIERATVSVALEESESWFAEATERRATDEQIQEVLASVERLEIFGQRALCEGETSLFRVTVR